MMIENKDIAATFFLVAAIIYEKRGALQCVLTSMKGVRIFRWEKS